MIRKSVLPRDGQINIFDTLVLLYSQYNLGPYQNVTLNRTTVTDIVPYSHSNQRCLEYKNGNSDFTKLYTCPHVPINLNSINSNPININELSLLLSNNSSVSDSLKNIFLITDK